MPRSVRLPDRDAITIARIEDAVVFMAWVVENLGEHYAPVLDRLLAELEAAKRRESPRDKARRILEAYTVDGGLKAIR